MCHPSLSKSQVPAFSVEALTVCYQLFTAPVGWIMAVAATQRAPCDADGTCCFVKYGMGRTREQTGGQGK
jgi:hypothetical protein